MNLQLNHVIDSAKILIISLSKDCLIEDFNQEAERFYEKSYQDVIGKDFLTSLIPGDYHEFIQKALNTVIEGIESAICEVPITPSLGKKAIIQWNFFHLIDHDNQFIGILALGQDITHIKMRENKLRVSEENYKIFLQNFQGIAYQTHLSTFELRLFMGKVEEITGYTSEEFLTHKIRWDKIIHPDDLSMVMEESKKLEGNSEYIADNEYRIYQKNGNLRWIRDISLKIYDTQSNERILQGSIYDITERKKIEQELKIQKALLESIFKAAPTGIGRVLDRVFTDVNDSFCDLIGFSRKELLGKSALMLYPTKEDYENVGKEKYDQIDKYGIGTVETRFKRKNGEIIDVLLSSSPIDIKDQSKGVTFTALNITERKKFEINLRNEKNLFKQITHTSPAGIMLINKEGKIVFANVHAKRVLGLTKDQIITLLIMLQAGKLLILMDPHF